MIPSIAEAFHGFAQLAAPTAVSGLWQGAAVAAGLAVCMKLAPRVAASHRFAAWAAGFGVAAGLPALPFLAQLVAGYAGSAAEVGRVAAGGAAHAWLEFDARWSLAIAGLWLAIAAYRVAGLAAHTVRLRGLWKSARPVGDGFDWPAGPALTHVRGVEVCTTRELDRPSVIGFFAPRILIPEWLLERLTREELEQVILHEVEHLRRRDDWTNLLQKLCLAVFPLNPALAWMDRRLAKEREMACDEGVVRLTGAPRAYAACLASLAERRLQNRAARAEALALGAFERRPELVQRVQSLLRGGRRLSPAAGWGLVGVAGCGLIFGAAGLARCPQVVAFVQEQPVIVADGSGAARASDAAAHADEGFHVVDTKAIVPVKRVAARSATAQPGSSRMLKTASAEPRAVEVKATIPASGAAQKAAKQELLVVTTWQWQADFRAQNVADYDDGPRAETQKENRPANAMAVTKMFVGVYRASQAAQAASQNKAANTMARPAAKTTDLKTLDSRQTAVPFGDGWLVIQL